MASSSKRAALLLSLALSLAINLSGAMAVSESMPGDDVPVELRPETGASGREYVKGPKDPTVILTVEATDTEKRFAISEQIYGVNDFEGSQTPQYRALYAEAGIALIRRGGNPASRYNWEFDAENKGSDYFFETIPRSKNGQRNSFDEFVQMNQAQGIETLATVPIMGWAAKSGDFGCSFRVDKYGPQASTDPFNANCGNGRSKDGAKVANSPGDLHKPVGPDHAKAWVASVAEKFGGAAKGGVRYWSLDNEPLWWSHTHRDIHPHESTYNEILELGIKHASAIKDADPSALVTGPVTAGWHDLFYSMKDLSNGWAKAKGRYWGAPIDREAHGGKPFLQWYLEEMRREGERQGRPILDLVDVHLYVAGEAGGPSADYNMQWQRIAATRALWDPHFSCGFCDWMDPVQAPSKKPRILARVKEIASLAFPGLGVAVTEYNFGGGQDISGAVAQAEALGVFGRMGVKLAAVFPHPDNNSVLMAFRMFRNYDGMGSRFGSVGVGSASLDNSRVSIHAAITVPNTKLTVLAINLIGDAVPISLALDVVPQGEIRVFRYSGDNLTRIVRLPDAQPMQQIKTTLPGHSLTMFEVPMLK